MRSFLVWSWLRRKLIEVWKEAVMGQAADLEFVKLEGGDRFLKAVVHMSGSTPSDPWLLLAQTWEAAVTAHRARSCLLCAAPHRTGAPSFGHAEIWAEPSTGRSHSALCCMRCVLLFLCLLYSFLKLKKRLRRNSVLIVSIIFLYSCCFTMELVCHWCICNSSGQWERISVSWK